MLNRGDAGTERENQLTDLKIYKRPIGLLMNINVPTLKSEIKRLVNQFQEFSAPQPAPSDYGC
jgi:hypothetical protein